MKKIILAFAAVSALFAQDFNYELSPTFSGVKPEGNIGDKNHYAVGLRAARNLESRILNQIELGFDYSSNVKLKNNDKANATRIYLNAVRDLINFSSFDVYGLVGGGYENWSKTYKKVRSGGFGQLGFGLKFKLGQRLNLRLEARDQIKFRRGDNTLIYTLGLGFNFGKSAHDDMKHDEMSHDEMKHDEMKHDEMKHDEMKHDEMKQEEVKYQEIKPVVIKEKQFDGIKKAEPKMIDNLDINFAIDSAVIAPKYTVDLRNLADFLEANEDYSLVLNGYADDTGTEEYNLDLSQRRADAVADALKNLGVSEDKISTKAHGEADPVASNETVEGRAANRRVEAKIEK